MKCQKCGKNIATVHTVTIVNGVKDEQYLCSECANDKKLDMSFSFPSVNDFFKEFVNSDTSLAEEKLHCLSCGCSYDEFRNTGLMGCPECYDSFRNRLSSVIKKYQGGNSKNKADKLDKQALSNEKHELKELKRQLDKAIKAENFEEAAVLRDRIKEAEAND